MSAAFEKTVEELERAYTEAQERLSDPAVYNDHREAARSASASRSSRSRTSSAGLAAGTADLDAALDAELTEMVADYDDVARLEDELRSRSSSATRGDKDVIVEAPGRRRRLRSGRGRRRCSSATRSGSASRWRSWR